MNKSWHTFFKTACGVFGGKPELLCVYLLCMVFYRILSVRFKNAILNAVQAEDWLDIKSSFMSDFLWMQLDELQLQIIVWPARYAVLKIQITVFASEILSFYFT